MVPDFDPEKTEILARWKAQDALYAEAEAAEDLLP